MDFLKDSNGKKQSIKRLWGNRSLTIGILLLLALFAMVIACPLIFGKELPQATFSNAFNVAITFMATSGGLLGVGVVEYLGKKK